MIDGTFRRQLARGSTSWSCYTNDLIGNGEFEARLELDPGGNAFLRDRPS